MPDSITILMSIAPLQSALTISGDGGGRLKLDFDDSQLPQVLNMMGWRGQLIEVTVRLAT